LRRRHGCPPLDPAPDLPPATSASDCGAREPAQAFGVAPVAPPRWGSLPPSVEHRPTTSGQRKPVNLGGAGRTDDAEKRGGAEKRLGHGSAPSAIRQPLTAGDGGTTLQWRRRHHQAGDGGGTGGVRLGVGNHNRPLSFFLYLGRPLWATVAASRPQSRAAAPRAGGPRAWLGCVLSRRLGKPTWPATAGRLCREPLPFGRLGRFWLPLVCLFIFFSYSFSNIVF
jgi:hypothetical protein